MICETKVYHLTPHYQALLEAARKVDEFLYVGYSFLKPGSMALFRKHPGFYTEFHIMDLSPTMSPGALRRTLHRMDDSGVNFESSSKKEMMDSKQAMVKANRERQREKWYEVGEYIRRNL